MSAPGVTVLCRKVSARHANPFLAPLSGRFDELDGQLWLEEVLVPWERVFLTEASPDPIAAWCFWHQLYAWLAKAEFTLGLALACAHAMGLRDHEPTIEHLMDLVVDVQTVRSCQAAAEHEPDITEDGYCVPGRAHVAAGSIAMQKARQRMAEILRIVPGSSLVVAPSDKDLTSPEVGAGLEESFGGGEYTALQRAALLQLAADHVASALDGRESAFELHANGGLMAWRARLRRAFPDYNALANGVRIDVVNPMVFDYYDRVTTDMGGAAVNASNGLHAQLHALLPAKTDAQLWAMQGATIMNGLDDYPKRTESTSLADAQQILNLANTNGMTMSNLSMWAIQRDNGGCPGSTGSNDCSGIVQGTWDFSHTLGPFTRP